MFNIYRPLSLLPSSEVPGSPASRHCRGQPFESLMRPHLAIAALPIFLFLPFGSPTGFPGTIKPTRRALPTPPLRHEPPPVPSHLSQTSLLQAFLVGFTPLFIRKRRGFVLVLIWFSGHTLWLNARHTKIFNTLHPDERTFAIIDLKCRDLCLLWLCSDNFVAKGSMTYLAAALHKLTEPSMPFPIASAPLNRIRVASNTGRKDWLTVHAGFIDAPIVDQRGKLTSLP
ncbi:hypothetical protein DFH06DRAFT_1342887 [Mycena polygramma]|nr:hypothetical protein DFH06DRAFT_1483524 [Mycena polygramma]KAJ7617468.1 hypothetical protein DFH06DRAFT_1342887 [Mycena polygramma]